MGKICIPIREKSLKKAQKQIKKANKYADFIEIWFDCFGKEADIKRLIKTSAKPVIAVCRAKPEKGGFSGTEKARIEILKKAVTAGAEFVDVGIHTNRLLIKDLKKTCQRYQAKLIISKHFWDGTPSLSVLIRVCKRAKSFGAFIVKIAAHIKKREDNVVLFELTKRLSEKGIKAIVVGMGEKGKISRLGCPLLGAYLAYVALSDSAKTAIGQMTIEHFDF